MQTTSDLAILHLVRAGNDNTAVVRFVDSYLKHPAGHHHRLIFLLKGFPSEPPRDLSAILDRVPHARMVCPDGGYDVGSYYHAIEQITERVVLFLNSHSIIGGELWLSKLAQAYSEPGVGLVGATGSWESIASTQLAASDAHCAPWTNRWFARLGACLIGFPLLVLFPAFPNPHVRSNAFMLAREDFLAVRPARIRFKFQAWLFESGRASMTRCILRRGLRVAVVGRDGKAYHIQEWPISKTFWQDQQENLLIQDNRTLAYSRANLMTRARLSRAAWNFPAHSTMNSPVGHEQNPRRKSD